MLVAPMMVLATNQRRYTKASASVAGEHRSAGQAPRRPRRLTHVRFGIADAEILEQIDTPLRIRVGQIFCGQVPKGQRRIGEQGDPLTVTQLCQSELIRPVQQAVRVLHRHHRGRPSSPASRTNSAMPHGCSFESPMARTLPSSTRVASASSCSGSGWPVFRERGRTATVRTSADCGQASAIGRDRRSRYRGGAGSPPAQRAGWRHRRRAARRESSSGCAPAPQPWWRQGSFAGLVFSQAPTIDSLAPLVGARAGTGYISAVSMKFTPARKPDQVANALLPRCFARRRSWFQGTLPKP